MYTRDAVLLDIKNVSKHYGTKQVLAGVNAQIRDLHCSEKCRIVGQVVAILGGSGVGKTTLLQILAGLEPATEGQVLLDATHTPVKRGMVGMVFQRYPVWSHRKVIGNLMLAGELAGMTSVQARSRATQYLESFGLAGDGDKFPGELSGGMQQRVAISRQLMSMDGPDSHPTRLLLLDEPFSALDLNNVHLVCRMLRTIADMHDETTLVLVTHDIRAALGVADLVWLMGRPKDATGKYVGGGRIMREIDTAAMELAWHEDIFETPEFQALEKEISAAYRGL